MVSDITKIIFLLIFIIFIGFILRIYKLGFHDLWSDEAYSAYLIRDDEVYKAQLARYPQLISRDPEAPLHILLLNGLVKLTGLSEFWLRFPAFIFGCLSIVAIYLFGNLLFERKVALWAAFLLAISPLYIWYSQEARAYTQITFLVILATYFFIRCIKENKLIFWIGFLFTQVAGFYTNYLFPLILIPQGIIILFKHNRRYIRNWFLSWFGTCLFFLPVINAFIIRLRSITEAFWILRPNLFSFYISFCNFNLGYTVTSTVYLISFILFFGILIFGIWNGLKKYKESTIIIILFAFIPIISAYLVSQLKSIYISRQMSMFLPFYLLLISLGIAFTKRQISKMAMMIALLCLTGSSLANYYRDKMSAPIEYHLGTYIKRPVKPVTKFIQDNYREGDIIAFSNPQYTCLFFYYLGKDYDYHYFIIPDTQDEYWRKIILTSFNIYKEGFTIDLTRVKNLPYKRIWLISGNWARDGNLDENSRAVRSYLEQDYIKMQDCKIEGEWITLYIKD